MYTLSSEERQAQIKQARIERNETILKLDGFLNWRIELDPEEALLFAQTCNTYNGHTNSDLACLMANIADITPRVYYNEGNPNNGSATHSFMIGNESSRVLYLKVRKHGMPEGFDYDTYGKLLDSFAQESNADEYWIEEDTDADMGSFRTGTFIYRFWWD